MYIYVSLSDTLLPPVIYISAIFHAARWRVHKPRSVVIQLVTDVTRTFVNVTFHTMILSALWGTKFNLFK